MMLFLSNSIQLHLNANCICIIDENYIVISFGDKMCYIVSGNKMDYVKI